MKAWSVEKELDMPASTPLSAHHPLPVSLDYREQKYWKRERWKKREEHRWGKKVKVGKDTTFQVFYHTTIIKKTQLIHTMSIHAYINEECNNLSAPKKCLPKSRCFALKEQRQEIRGDNSIVLV